MESGQVYPCVNCSDVELLSDDHLKYLVPLTYKGLVLKAKIIKIIDGDSFDALIYLSLHQLSILKNKKIGRGRSNKTEPFVPIITNNINSGFFTKVEIRAYGIDTAEKNTKRGLLAKSIMQYKYSLSNNIVYLSFKGTEKYGRHLCEIYSDPSLSIPLHNYILQLQQDPIFISKYGIIAHEYYGDKKLSFDPDPSFYPSSYP